MTTERVFMGLALIVVLAVGSQLLAHRLRIPALIVLLPAGFAAGALTSSIHPDQLLGDTFSPLVSLAVAVVLYDAGLGLDLKRLTGHPRRVVVRLIWIGAGLTWGIAALAAIPLFGLSSRAAVMLGAILVVSGPTVVGPLLTFVRPDERLQRILIWEGSVIDAVGGILGALVFHAVAASAHGTPLTEALRFLVSMGVGLAGGAAGVALLWWLLRSRHLGEVLGTSAQLAVVIGIAAVCNIIRDDTGLIAAVVMGIAVATLPGFDVPARRAFFETLVSLIVGLLFISISATVTPSSLHGLLLPALGFVAVLVLVARPLVAVLSTLGTELRWGERAFIGWMMPRGIVAASTAATFSAELVDRRIGGAEKILPVTFLVIVATVTLYGLTAGPVARRLGAVRPARSRPLLVGGEPWVIDLARALRSSGLDVVMWATREDQRRSIAEAGLELAPGELLAAATGEGAELEGITGVYLLTGHDDFNALAAKVLQGTADTPVHRLAPSRRSEGVAPLMGGATLFAPGLTGEDVAARHAAGARIEATGDGPAAGGDVLFTVDAEGRLTPAVGPGGPAVRRGDTVVWLGPSGADPYTGSSRYTDPLRAST